MAARTGAAGACGDNSSDALRVVLVTAGGAYGRLVAHELRRRGVELAAVVADVHRPSWRRVLRRPRSVAGWARRRVASRHLRAFGRLHVVGNLNKPAGVRLLHSLAPDLLVLAGARILSETVLATARHGALSAHPARLPTVRGRGVVVWSILGGHPVTVTVHYVSPEVDAGDVIESRLVPIEPGDTLEVIEERADRLAAVALADVAAQAVRGEQLPRSRQGPGGAVLDWPTRASRERCERLVAAGEALRLYRDAHG